VKVIVVLPTEALATQVYSVFETYSTWASLRIFLMSKRHTFLAEADRLISTGRFDNAVLVACLIIAFLLNQFMFYNYCFADFDGTKQTKWDIIIATPGRLVDHLSQTDGFDISQLQFLIVDEADRTLDDQEGEWLQRLEMKFWTSNPVDGNSIDFVLEAF